MVSPSRALAASV